MGEQLYRQRHGAETSTLSSLHEAAAELSGRTVLQAAAENGHTEAMKWLLTKGANINAPPATLNRRIALQVAAEYGHLQTVKWMFDKTKANVNAWPTSMSGRPRCRPPPPRMGIWT